MTMETLDSNISSAQDEIEQVRNTTEVLVPLFAQVIAKFIGVWSNNIVERAISEKPEITMSLGKEKLGQMKEQFRGILQSALARTESRLNHDSIWPHRTDIPKGKESDGMGAYELNKRHEEQLNEALRELIGEAGELLVAYGYSNLSGQEWEKRNGKLRYKYGISDYGNPHASEMKQLNEQYKKAMDKYVVAAKKLKDAKKSKASAEAKNLWAEV